MVCFLFITYLLVHYFAIYLKLPNNINKGFKKKHNKLEENEINAIFS